MLPPSVFQENSLLCSSLLNVVKSCTSMPYQSLELWSSDRTLLQLFRIELQTFQSLFLDFEGNRIEYGI